MRILYLLWLKGTIKVPPMSCLPPSLLWMSLGQFKVESEGLLNPSQCNRLCKTRHVGWSIILIKHILMICWGFEANNVPVTRQPMHMIIPRRHSWCTISPHTSFPVWWFSCFEFRNTKSVRSYMVWSRVYIHFFEAVWVDYLRSFSAQAAYHIFEGGIGPSSSASKRPLLSCKLIFSSRCFPQFYCWRHRECSPVAKVFVKVYYNPVSHEELLFASNENQVHVRMEL